MTDDTARLPSGLTANLFSVIGKMTVKLVRLEGGACYATTAAPPPVGSVAVLSRNGVRAAATVSAAEATGMTLTFDEPIGRRRLDWLLGFSGERPIGEPAPAPSMLMASA